MKSQIPNSKLQNAYLEFEIWGLYSLGTKKGDDEHGL
jgi:hypothetical protein